MDAFKCINTCVKRQLSKRPKIGFQDQFSLNAGQKYCRIHQGSILQYFRPSLSYHFVITIFVFFLLFLSGRFTQVLLYKPINKYFLYIAGWLHVGYNQYMTINKTDADVPFNTRVYEGGHIKYPPRAFFYRTKLYASGKVQK